jgi:hypothetical protein
MGRYLTWMPVAEPAMPRGTFVVFLSLIILLWEFLKIHVIWLLHSCWEDISVSLCSLCQLKYPAASVVTCVMPYVPSWWLVVAALGRTPVPLPHTINTPAAKGNWHRQTIIFSFLYSHMQKQDEEFHCFAPLVTACSCSIESNKRERKRELILVCWVMAMCRLGDCVIGSWRLQATCRNIEGENTSSLLRSVGYNNPFTHRHIPEERNLQPHLFENLWTGKGRRILSCWRHVGCSEYPQDGCRRVLRNVR